MVYDTEISTRDSSEVSKSPSYVGRVLAGVGAVAMTCLTAATLTYFSPTYFAEWKGDIPFSTSEGYWEGYVRCGKRGEKAVFIEEHDGKIVSLERALSNVPEELGRRDCAREDIMEAVDKCDCSD